MATTVPAPASISIDVTKDLESSSALKNLLTSQQGAVFNLVGELIQFVTAQSAAAAGASASITLSAEASWKTPNGIGFSLAPKASCSIKLATTSTSFSVGTSIEDSSKTMSIVAGPTAGIVYVNIDLDFDIAGSASGSGTFSGVGVAGSASGSANATFSFCQPVDGTLSTIDAVKLAFSSLVFPLDPDCTETMTPGCIAKVNFDGAFDIGLNVTYGLGDYKVSAPSLAKVQQSLNGVVSLTPPSLEIQAGAKGSVSFTHTDHFGLIVNKTSAAAANLYLVRSDENDSTASVGFSVGVTTTAASVTIDQSALQQTVQSVTGSSALAGAVVSAASQPLNNLQTSLNAKLESWASDATGQVGLTASLSRQSGRIALFTFDLDLTSTQLEASWKTLVSGQIPSSLPGFTVEAGSGVSESLKRSSTIQFQFFNLFNFSSTTDFFKNAFTEFGPDGTIRVVQDVGQEQQIKTKNALAEFRIHFVTTANEAGSTVTQDSVDLYIELTETNDPKNATVMANLVGLLPTSSATHLALTTMLNYVTAHPTGTLNLINIIKRSAYQKYSFSPYNGSKPLPLPHAQDQNNWNAFQAATELLMPDLGFVPNLNFPLWINFNRACIDQLGSQVTPDRKQTGNPNAVPPSFFTNLGPQGLVTFFFLASAGAMNLFEDLQTLATAVAQVDTSVQYNDLLNFITNLVTNDVFIDYAKPTAGVLLSQAGTNAQITTSADLAADQSSLTCTVTIA